MLRLPLAKFPAFARGGVAIPLGPAVQHTGEHTGRPAVETVLEFRA